MKIMSIVGARPNFMKVASIADAARGRDGVDHSIIHTGQHYDERMSGSFFTDLDLPKPDINLGIGSGSHAQQTGRVMMAIEPVLEEQKPDAMIVVGDVNSTLACAITATKMDIPVAHVEAGLRSGDRTMPEEINRLAVDAICEILHTTDTMADACLAREGVDPARVTCVGNTMIDTLLRHKQRAEKQGFPATLGLEGKPYAVLTLHRPASVDNKDRLSAMLTAIRQATEGLHLVFPIHPRTRRNMERFGLMDMLAGMTVTEPLGYLDFLGLNAGADLVVTDSGGLQEETTILGVNCVTLRENTERPITIDQGTNRMGGVTPDTIVPAIKEARATPPSGRVPEMWDGKAGGRILDDLARRLGSDGPKRG
ncbi:MAG: UDP-N-acetylglucosamine 2-epimerase (non-hydrolyzing) [Pseudomonadota bacterium]